ncbi:MAG: hypothetical protein K2X39_05540, partial [Silvanigrellaceae bacterium]|nr:hypothetical protein [Silvanigrellaceae bacterium]
SPLANIEAGQEVLQPVSREAEDSQSNKSLPGSDSINLTAEQVLQSTSVEDYCDQPRFSDDKDLSAYDFSFEDLIDKVWKEQGQEAFKKEVSNIKDLKKTFKQQKKTYADSLKREFPLFPVFNEKSSEIVYKALKIKGIYKKDYYTFLHGRSIDWKVYFYFIKTLIKTIKPDVPLNLIEFLRPPFKTNSTLNANEFINKYNHTINDHVPFFQKQLICADTYWLSRAKGESALFFFEKNNFQVWQVQDACIPIISSLLDKNLQGCKVLLQSLSSRILSITTEMRSKTSNFPGELVVICLPKTMVNDSSTNAIYRSWPLGVPCSNIHTLSDTAILENLQQDVVPETIQKNKLEANIGLQYRLLASHLVPKNGVRIFGVNALPKELKETYKQPIKDLVGEIIETIKKGS